MVQKKLQLNLMTGAGRNNAKLTFKSDDGLFVIAQLVNARQFVANTEQLRRSIISGGGKQTWIELLDGYGNEWLLECRYMNRVVAVDLWYQHPGFEDHLQTDFSWDGGVGEFDVSVRKLVAFFKKK